jgi:hypothetical protein
LGTFLAGRKNKRFCFSGAGKPGPEVFPEPRGLRRVKAGQIIQSEAQGYLGIYLVDVLASRPSGTGKNNFRGSADRLTKYKNIQTYSLKRQKVYFLK